MSARWAVANANNHTGGGGGGPWLLSQTAIVEETGSMLLATIGECGWSWRLCLPRLGAAQGTRTRTRTPTPATSAATRVP
jgi:hypothetical protein